MIFRRSRDLERQGQGSFDGRPHAWGPFSLAWVDNGIYVNAEEETLRR
jgi:hypothetical protein